MNYFKVILPYGDSFASDSIITNPENNPDAMRVHFYADEYPPAIMETAGVYAAAQSLKTNIYEAGFTGIYFRPCGISKSPQYLAIKSNDPRPLPIYYHAVIKGKAHVDDFGLEGRNTLIISQRVATLLTSLKQEDLDIIPADDP